MLRKGRYAARLASSPADLAAAQRLRHRCFFERGAAQGRPDGIDRDGFDRLCRHVLIEESDGRLIATFRFLPLISGAEIHLSYAAQYYDLASLSNFSRPLAEIGRFCMDTVEGRDDGEAIRAAWGALTALVRAHGVSMLFGCASFSGATPSRHAAALAHLHARHLGPADRRPTSRAATSLALADFPAGPPREALRQMPPLLRSYLAMGGWVGDRAVIDADLDTLHVFTALDIAALPAARARSLIALST